MDNPQYKENADKIVELVEGMTLAQWNKVKAVIDGVFASLESKVKFEAPDTIEILMKQNFIN